MMLVPRWINRLYQYEYTTFDLLIIDEESGDTVFRAPVKIAGDHHVEDSADFLHEIAAQFIARYEEEQASILRRQTVLATAEQLRQMLPQATQLAELREIFLTVLGYTEETYDAWLIQQQLAYVKQAVSLDDQVIIAQTLMERYLPETG